MAIDGGEVTWYVFSTLRKNGCRTHTRLHPDEVISQGGGKPRGWHLREILEIKDLEEWTIGSLGVVEQIKLR